MLGFETLHDLTNIMGIGSICIHSCDSTITNSWREPARLYTVFGLHEEGYEKVVQYSRKHKPVCVTNAM